MTVCRLISRAAFVALVTAIACLVLAGLAKVGEMLTLGGDDALIAKLIIFMGCGGLFVTMLAAWLDELAVERR